MILFNVSTQVPFNFQNALESELPWVKVEYVHAINSKIHVFVCTYREDGLGCISLENLLEVASYAGINVWDILIQF